MKPTTKFELWFEASIYMAITTYHKLKDSVAKIQHNFNYKILSFWREKTLASGDKTERINCVIKGLHALHMQNRNHRTQFKCMSFYFTHY